MRDDDARPPVAPTRPFHPVGLGRRVAPFGIGAVVALAIGLPTVTGEGAAWYAVALALTVGAIGVALIISRAGTTSAVDALPPYLFIAAVVAVRHATGGAASGYSTLFLVPVIWLALYGSRGQLFGALALVAVGLAAPEILVGPPDYPATEWRRAIILVGVAASLGLIVQGLVAEVRSAEARAAAGQRTAHRQRDIADAILTAASDAIVSFDRTGNIVAANDEAASMFQRADLVGQDVFHVLVPDAEEERLRAGMDRLISADVPDATDTRFEAELVRRDGDRVPADIAVAITDGDEGLRIHAFVRDLTARREVERAAQEHRADLDRLLAVAEDLGRPHVDSRSAICAAARDFADADFALLYTMDAGRGRLVVTGSAGRDDPPSDIELDPDDSVAGDALRSGEPVFIGDLDADPRIDKSITIRVGAAAAFLQPIAVDGRPVGVLVAYWRKPVAELPERVLTMFRLFAIQAAVTVERADLLGRLESLARTDPLTGAANRRALDDVLDAAIADAGRSGRPLSVVMLDLDHFKRFNDDNGHQAGDDLLRESASAWRTLLRRADTLARYGGEEFVVVLPDGDDAAAMVAADRLRAALRDGVTGSAGVATWDGDEPAAGLIGRADAALYRAKQAGRDRVVSVGTKPVP